MNPEQTQYSRFTQGLITIAVMLVAVAEVLDMTIVNVALPHMMGSLSANTQQITWVLTSYIVAAAVVMPLTGFLVERFGQKQVLLWSILGFLIASMLCGMAASIEQMVFFRTCQGLFGATLVPLSQTILHRVYPPEERSTAMAIWGVGIMAGPVLGPTLGGYITMSMTWRWIFYINMPICVCAFLLAWRVIPETTKKKIFVDWSGLLIMALAIGSLQIFLDQGNEYNWFESDSILILAVVSVMAWLIFLSRGWGYDKNIIKLSIFMNRNFSIATLLVAVYCGAVFSTIAIQPIMLESLFNMPADTVGLLLAPRGVCCAISMGFMPILMKHFDSRYLVALGLLFNALSAWVLTQYNLSADSHLIFYSGMIQGFGMGLFFVPITTLAMSTLEPNDTAEGAGLFSFGRSIGSSIGISAITTVLTRQSQVSWHDLVEHLSISSPTLNHWLLQWPGTLTTATKVLGVEVERQANMVAYLDCYWLSFWIFIAMLPLVLLMSKQTINSQAAMVH